MGNRVLGALDKHPYELYLELNEIEHTKIQGEESSDRWDVREVSSDHCQRILQGDLQKRRLLGTWMPCNWNWMSIQLGTTKEGPTRESVVRDGPQWKPFWMERNSSKKKSLNNLAADGRSLPKRLVRLAEWVNAIRNPKTSSVTLTQEERDIILWKAAEQAWGPVVDERKCAGKSSQLRIWPLIKVESGSKGIEHMLQG